MEDKQIIELFFKRDQDAIKETEQKYKQRLQNIAYNILSSKEDAEECLSDTYLAAWNSIPPHKPQSFIAYLARLTRNAALDRLEKRNAKKRNAETLPLIEEIADLFPQDSEELLDRIAFRESLNRFLRALPKEKRILFVRRYFFFDSIEEIARAERVGESKVKTTLYRIRLELKDHLLREGISL